MTAARNIHLPPPEAPATEPTLPRLREVTNDPAREYAARPGAVEPLPDSVAAMILCYTALRPVERQQIKLQIDGKEYAYASSQSITIAEKNGTGEKVLCAVNRRAPDVLHILTPDGVYIETLPRKGEATWLQHDEASREALAETRRMRQRDMARLEELHEPDTRAALAREAHNASEVARVVRSVNTFPVAGSDRHTPADKPEADEIIAPGRGTLGGCETPLIPDGASGRRTCGEKQPARKAKTKPTTPRVSRGAAVPMPAGSGGGTFSRAARVFDAIDSVDARRAQYTARQHRDADLAALVDDALDEIFA